jgi:serine/threonine protein phosphatase 1
MTIYAIGDIHGHLDKLLHAHDLVETDKRARGHPGPTPVDPRGRSGRPWPDSAGVVGYLRDCVRRNPGTIVLKGNHDSMFVEFLSNRPGRWSDPRYLHRNTGGRGTLTSYGVPATGSARALHDAALDAVPQEDRAFLADLPLSHRAGECVFVHAGIQPGVPLDEQDPADLMWIRDAFLYDTREHGMLVVHGHTPVDTVEHHGNRLAIDTGAGWDGPVSAVAIEGREAWLLTQAGRKPVARIS